MSASHKCDCAALAVLAIGVVLMVQPWWKLGFQGGFFVTFVGIIAQMITGHVAAAAASRAQVTAEKRSTP